MRGNRGIRVPADPNAFLQDYLGSTVIEYYEMKADRDKRVVTLQSYGRNPLSFVSHFISQVDPPNVTRIRFGVRWIEPRGEELKEAA